MTAKTLRSLLRLLAKLANAGLPAFWGFFWFLIFSKFFFLFSCLLFRFTHSKLKLQLTANLKEV